jgi:hypothetical protein
MQRYTKINESIEARVHDGYLYVRLTGIRLGMLVQGERAGRVYRMPYASTDISDAIAHYGEYETVIDRAMDPDHGEIVKQGRLIR